MKTKKDKDQIATIPVLIKKFPRSLWQHFRAACSLRGKYANETIIELVRKHLESMVPK